MTKTLFPGKSIALISGVLLIGISSLKITAQTNDNSLPGWDRNVLVQANTGNSATYLSDEEKKVIFYTNLCRLKPKLFCQTVLADYLRDHTEKPSVVESLKKTLNEDKPRNALIPDEELCKMSRTYAKKMGAEGKEGHLDFQNRIKPFMKRFNKVGENCDYGHSLALDAFMNLLIDSNEPTILGHRKNILDVDFSVIGISCQPHKIFHWNYVMDFGG